MAARRDIAVGMITSSLSMVIGLAVVPVYLRLLGVEAYGLVSFIAVLQAVAQLLDLGLTPTISREVARARGLGQVGESRTLLHSLACIYVLTGAALSVVIYFLSRVIATQWINVERLPTVTVIEAVAWMGVIVGLRWPLTIYSGALIGDHRLATVAIVNLIALTLSSVGVILVLLFVSPSIIAFFISQAAVAALHLLVMRHLAWRDVGGRGPKHFDIAALKSVWRFSIAMSGVTITAVALTQLDKVVTSKLLSLETFAYYALGGIVGRALYGLINPLYHVIYPRFCAMVAGGRSEELARSYRLWTTAFTSVFFPASMAIAVGAVPLVHIWSGDAELALHVGPLAALIAVGSAIHGVMYFPYSLQLAQGDTRLALLTNVVLLTIYLPTLAVLTFMTGVQGAALSWPVLTFFYLVFGTWATHRRHLRGLGWAWLSRDVGVPLLITVVCGVAGTLIFRHTTISTPAQLLVSAGAAFLALCANAIIALHRYHELRSELNSALKFRFVG